MKLPSYQTLSIALLILILCAFDCLGTSLYWQHQAVVHHGAFFEADSWGWVSFKWNDVSYAQTPFQDEMWTRIQNSITEQKLKAFNTK